MNGGLSEKEAREIKNKIEYLKKYDTHRLIFGAKKHNYKFIEKATAQEIEAFEKFCEIKLPKDYADFIMKIGNGGAGPAYGLVSLNYETEFRYNKEELKYLKKPFLFDKDIDLSEQENEFECRRNDCRECEYNDRCWQSDFIDGEYADIIRYNCGSFTICDEGCTYSRIMIMNGKCYGEIWGRSEGEELKRFGGQSFKQWYTEWLDESIRLIKPYVDAVEAKMGFDEIVKINTGWIFNTMFTESKAELIDGIAGLKTIKTDKRYIDSNYREENKKRYIDEVKKRYESYRNNGR